MMANPFHFDITDAKKFDQDGVAYLPTHWSEEAASYYGTVTIYWKINVLCLSASSWSFSSPGHHLLDP